MRLGDVVSPEGIAFAYHFTSHAALATSNIRILYSESSGKLQGTNYPKVLEGSINPFKREFLFQPRLTLYLNRPEWIDAFRSPHYTVVLGRSQDLFIYTSIQTIELQQAEHAYFEHTLLPYDMAVQMGSGIVELLPRYLDYERKRTPTFARYLLLTERRLHSNEFWNSSLKAQQCIWIDPTSHIVKMMHYLGLVFHTFVGEEHEVHLAGLTG